MCFPEGGRGLLFSELPWGFPQAARASLLHPINTGIAEPKVLLLDVSYSRAKIGEPQF